jgi:hypothetical protein
MAIQGCAYTYFSSLLPTVASAWPFSVGVSSETTVMSLVLDDERDPPSTSPVAVAVSTDELAIGIARISMVN